MTYGSRMPDHITLVCFDRNGGMDPAEHFMSWQSLKIAASSNVL